MGMIKKISLCLCLMAGTLLCVSPLEAKPLKEIIQDAKEREAKKRADEQAARNAVAKAAAKVAAAQQAKEDEENQSENDAQSDADESVAEPADDEDVNDASNDEEEDASASSGGPNYTCDANTCNSRTCVNDADKKAFCKGCAVEGKFPDTSSRMSSKCTK